MFVQPELPHLASAFAREGITVAPLHDDGDELPLPSGVELNRGLAAYWKQKKIRHYLWAPTWPGFLQELWCGWRKGGWVGAARVWRWAAIAKATWQWLQTFEPPNKMPLLLYTYWRGGQTMAAVRYTLQNHESAAVTRVHGYDRSGAPLWRVWALPRRAMRLLHRLYRVFPLLAAQCAPRCSSPPHWKAANATSLARPTSITSSPTMPRCSCPLRPRHHPGSRPSRLGR